MGDRSSYFTFLCTGHLYVYASVSNCIRFLNYAGFFLWLPENINKEVPTSKHTIVSQRVRITSQGFGKNFFVGVWTIEEWNCYTLLFYQTKSFSGFLRATHRLSNFGCTLWIKKTTSDWIGPESDTISRCLDLCGWRMFTYQGARLECHQADMPQCKASWLQNKTKILWYPKISKKTLKIVYVGLFYDVQWWIE